jgi:hypothetical protein
MCRKWSEHVKQTDGTCERNGYCKHVDQMTPRYLLWHQYFYKCRGCPRKLMSPVSEWDYFALSSLHKEKRRKKRSRTRYMCIQHVLLTDSSKIKKYGTGVVSSGLMFIASFVNISSVPTMPARWTHKHTLSLCSRRKLCLKKKEIQ